MRSAATFSSTTARWPVSAMRSSRADSGCATSTGIPASRSARASVSSAPSWLTTSTDLAPATRTAPRAVSFSGVRSPAPASRTWYSPTPARASTSRNTSRLRPGSNVRLPLDSTRPSRSSANSRSVRASLFTHTLNWNGSPAATSSGKSRRSTATSSPLARAIGRTSMRTPRAKARRATGSGSRPLFSPSETTSSDPGRSSGISASAVSSAPPRSEPSRSSGSVKPLKRASRSGAFDGRVRAEGDDADATPSRRASSASSGPVATASASPGIERERSTTTIVAPGSLRAQVGRRRRTRRTTTNARTITVPRRANAASTTRAPRESQAAATRDDKPMRATL